MTPPRKVKVGPHRFSLYAAKGLVDAGCTGGCGEDTQSIVIDDDLGVTVEKETVLHELMHAIWHQTTLDRTYTDEQEEQVVWSLAPFILALLRENPRLVAYLTE